ncbi:MAG TPA: cytochrome c oxidase assembly protein [Dongiaceae bacterium]|nr:cytochrome c oxidase assembly protein [Dongiaceae bacterium]
MTTKTPHSLGGPARPRRRRHLAAVLGSLALVGAATALSAYSVTLYRLFCQATGYLGTTQRVTAASATTSPETVVVRFDTSIAPDLPWRFKPEQEQVTVHLGEQTLVYFQATNLSREPIVGHASFNVQPDEAGRYFDKIQCFCFTEERLGPGQTAEMPVLFYVDPAILKDPDGSRIKTITLSYTFFRSPRPGETKDLSRYEKAGPPTAVASAERGRQLFGVRCAVCHGLDTNKTGPMLDGVVGRKAGTAPGYGYSPALSKAGVVWSAETLDKWLQDPKAFVAGARMPVRVPAADDRRDLIAYLQTLAAEKAPAKQAAAE